MLTIVSIFVSLLAAVWTKNIMKAHRVADKLNVSTIFLKELETKPSVDPFATAIHNMS